MNEPKNSKILIPLSNREEEIGKIIVNAAYKVHLALGPGLLEKIYEICLTYELKKAGLEAIRQVDIPIQYEGIKFDEGLRVDIFVENLVICEIKAVEQINSFLACTSIKSFKINK